jgi:hypothetical protein
MLMSEVIYHLLEIRKLLKEILKLLKEGSR